ncbi:transmembrane protein 41 homolog isoform X2 [Cylas formicarius]|uniref:transmembrane protein 41 homolog isoform X2 n=1 Tax=Cylas formicarius TaxID=197179 RepID=UPI002958D894|nr:transmembrane protein 41 homolog isoform X2 [Cylas formicarius]
MACKTGENTVQCNVVSSSSDLYNCPFVSNFPLHGRAHYRFYRRVKLSTHPTNSRMNSSNPVPKIPRDANGNVVITTRKALLAVASIFAGALFMLYLLYRTFPNVTDEERQHLKVPWNIEDAKQLGLVLSRYKGDHYYHVMAGVFLTYIFLQSFAIPGSLFLSILSGFLFPFYVALLLVCTCSMIGATLCFMLSQLLGRRLVLKHFPDRAHRWAIQVEEHKNNLFNYMVFLRITPILPNWFINLTAPVIGVPLIPFALGTFVGVAPPSFFAIQGGQTLLAMTAEDNAFNMQTFSWLAVFALISIIPIFLKNKV